MREQQPGSAAENPEEHGFDQKLSNHPSTARPQRKPHGDLGPPRRAAGEQQVRDIDGSNDQADAHDRQQIPQFLRQAVISSHIAAHPGLQCDVLSGNPARSLGA